MCSMEERIANNELINDSIRNNSGDSSCNCWQCFVTRRDFVVNGEYFNALYVQFPVKNVLKMFYLVIGLLTCGNLVCSFLLNCNSRNVPVPQHGVATLFR